MKKKLVAVLSVVVLSLTGCGGVMPNMTDEQAEAIGEYAAITLLKYDANSRSRLVDVSQIQEEASSQEDSALPEQTQEPTQNQDTQTSSETPVVDLTETGEAAANSMEEFLELPEGVSLSYNGYELSQSYQEDNAYFALEASEGKVLLALDFLMSNDSGAEQEINLLERRDVYRVTVNGSYTRTALTTMLDNDLSTYEGTLPAGAQTQVVLLIELDEGQTETIDTISLNLKNASETYTIQIL
jgi:hypothetical protein